MCLTSHVTSISDFEATRNFSKPILVKIHRTVAQSVSQPLGYHLCSTASPEVNA